MSKVTLQYRPLGLGTDTYEVRDNEGRHIMRKKNEAILNCAVNEIHTLTQEQAPTIFSELDVLKNILQTTRYTEKMVPVDSSFDYFSPGPIGMLCQQAKQIKESQTPQR